MIGRHKNKGVTRVMIGIGIPFLKNRRRRVAAVAVLTFGLLLGALNQVTQAQLNYSLVAGNGKTLAITGKDTPRGAQSLILFTPDSGETTRTNGFGVEISAVKEKKHASGEDTTEQYYTVKQVQDVWTCKPGHKKQCGNLDIPQNGIVISASGNYRKPLLEALTPGSHFGLKPAWFQSKSLPLSIVDPTPFNNPLASGFPGYRGSHQLIIYDKNYGQPQTGTNEFGFEVTVVDGIVIAQEGSNSQIPENGFVLSGHGRARDWLINNAPLGAKIDVSDDPQNNQKTIKSTIDLSTYRYQLSKRLQEAPCQVNKTVNAACKPVSRDLDEIENLQNKGSLDQAAALAYHSLETFNEALWKQYPALPQSAIKAIWHRPVELSRADIGDTLDYLKKSGLNTVFLESYFHGYTIFPSQTYTEYGLPNQNPKFAHEEKSDKPFDPLAVWIEEAHKRGMKLHIWFQTFYAGNSQAFGIGPILTKHPDWVNIQNSALSNTSGKLIPSTLESGAYFTDPANPAVQNFLLKLIEEIVTRYPIDGFQLDYIRYPASFPPDRFSYLKTTWGYTPFAREQFRAQTGFDPADFTKPGINDDQKLLWQQWNLYKVMQVSRFVQSASGLIRRKNPHILISAAVFPALKESVTQKHQDWVGWIQNGWLDMLEPMTLTSAVKVVQADTERAVKATDGKVPVISGVFGPFNGNSAEHLLQQIEAARLAGASGFSIFDTAHLTGRMTKALHASQAASK